MNNEKISFQKAIFVIGISLFLGFCFDFFFYEKALGISFVLYTALLVLGLFALFTFLGKKIRTQIFLFLIPLFFFSGMVFVRANDLLTFLNVVVSLFLLLLMTETMVGRRVERFFPIDYFSLPFLPFQFLRPFLETIAHFFSFGRKKISQDKEITRQVLKGVFLSAPILLLFLLLFSSADVVFHQYLNAVFSFHLAPDFFERFFLITFVSCFCIGGYSYVLEVNKNHDSSRHAQQNQTLGQIENTIVLSSVNILFFLFLLVQFTYFFGGEKNISLEGFTYAEYARQGFFELIIVAVLSFFLLLSFEKYAIRKHNIHHSSFQVLSTILILQVIVIMLSAFLRLSLYESVYGFTTLRLYSHAFIIFLGVVFCLLLHKIHKDTEETRFVFSLFLTSIAFVASMNVVNPDAFIARHNVERFLKTGDVDISYLNSLSDDATPETIKIFDALSEEEKQTFALLFSERLKIHRDSALSWSTWQSFHLARMKSEEILLEKEKELELYFREI